MLGNMAKKAILIFLALLSLFSAVWAFEPKAYGEPSEPQMPAYVPGELLVKYTPSLSAAAALYYRTRWGVSSVRTFRAIGVQHVRLPEDMTVEEALEIFKGDPGVAYAEPNYYCYATATPVDTHFDQLWGLHNTGQSVNGTSGTPDADMDAPEAWDITTGSSDVVIVDQP
jgi:hypothetical protein